MPKLLTYNVFISHSWKYKNEYEKLIKYIQDRKHLNIKDFSVPFDRPILLKDKLAPNNVLSEKLENKIKLINIFIVFAGMYASYSNWIEKEVKMAKSFNKPILVIKPQGQILTPKFLQENGDYFINWQYENFVNAIREYSI